MRRIFAFNEVTDLEAFLNAKVNKVFSCTHINIIILPELSNFVSVGLLREFLRKLRKWPIILSQTRTPQESYENNGKGSPPIRLTPKASLLRAAIPDQRLMWPSLSLPVLRRASAIGTKWEPVFKTRNKLLIKLVFLYFL